MEKVLIHDFHVCRNSLFMRTTADPAPAAAQSVHPQAEDVVLLRPMRLTGQSLRASVQGESLLPQQRPTASFWQPQLSPARAIHPHISQQGRYADSACNSTLRACPAFQPLHVPMTGAESSWQICIVRSLACRPLILGQREHNMPSTPKADYSMACQKK